MELIPVNKFWVTTNPDLATWESFVLTHPEGNIFQTPAIVQLYNSLPHIKATVLAVTDETGTVYGVLVFSILQEAGVKKIFTKRSVINGGPLIKGNDPVVFQLLLDAYANETKGERIIYTEIRNHYNTSAFRNLFEHGGYAFKDHLNIYIDLLKSREELTGDLHKKRLGNIRRAVKKGVFSREIKGEEEIRSAYNLIKKTYQRVNLPLPPPDLFLKASEYLGNCVRMYGAFSEEKMIGARIYLLFRETIYDWYAGSDDNYFYLHPNDILPWDMFWRGKAEYFKVYDFGGAGSPDKPYGVRTYKERFGGNTVNRGRYTKVHNFVLYKFGRWAIKYYKYFRHL